jgi:Restriction endonuclease
MAVEWREFEQLVARIEKTLAPKGAVVRSPDRVKDLFTGQDREVDASIRFKIGTVLILITVECRKRDRVQDDTWLEQLATKRTKIGAAKTIAVASSGFSGPATITAGLTGIEVRVISEITTEDIVSWLGIAGIETVVDRTELVTFRWGNYGAPTQLHPDILAQLEADRTRSLVFVQVADGQRLCIQDSSRSDNSKR